MKLISNLLTLASAALLAQAAYAQEDLLAKGEYLTRAANCVALPYRAWRSTLRRWC